ncbi:MAG: alpha-glucosidase C-terminal domain-containing protein, partial [Flavobacteriaceae bacterium]|nr:alpha-glucosidase C-terminal domain-containing protein [Flavobacteriaceae bacterium]
TPYCYFGDELGMTNIYFKSIDQYQDIAAINGYKKAMSEGQDMDVYLETLSLLSRDNGRTPMQWNGSDHAGFTQGTPWLPVNENYTDINQEKEDKDPLSVLNFFRKMTRLRNENPVLVYGDYKLLAETHPTVYAYTRTLGDVQMLVLLNFSETNSKLQLPELESVAKIVINNYDDVLIGDDSIQLQPYQAVIFEIK